MTFLSGHIIQRAAPACTGVGLLIAGVIGVGVFGSDREDAPSCDTCRISLQRVAVLGDETTPGAQLLPITQIVRNSTGEYFAAPTAVPGQVAVFGTDGRLARTIGRDGDGPGELRAVRFLRVGPADSLWVAADNGRVSVFHADGAFARSFDLPGFPLDLHFLPGSNEMLLHSNNGNVHNFAPLLLYGSHDLIQISPPSDFPRPVISSYEISTSDSSMLFVDTHTYELYRYSLDGKLQWRGRRDVAWFNDRVANARYERGRVLGIHEDEHGLWVAYMRRKDLPKRPNHLTEREVRPSRTLLESVRPTYYIDLLDAGTGRLVATNEIAGVELTGFLPTGEAYCPVTDDAGDVQFWVLRVGVGADSVAKTRRS